MEIFVFRKKCKILCIFYDAFTYYWQLKDVSLHFKQGVQHESVSISLCLNIFYDSNIFYLQGIKCKICYCSVKNIHEINSVHSNGQREWTQRNLYGRVTGLQFYIFPLCIHFESLNFNADFLAKEYFEILNLNIDFLDKEYFICFGMFNTLQQYFIYVGRHLTQPSSLRSARCLLLANKGDKLQLMTPSVKGYGGHQC